VKQWRTKGSARERKGAEAGGSHCLGKKEAWKNKKTVKKLTIALALGVVGADRLAEEPPPRARRLGAELDFSMLNVGREADE